MKNFPPSVSPRTFTSSAIFVAYLLMNDLTINEQNAIGDWLMLVGQVLQTNASQRQILDDRNKINQEDDSFNTLKEEIDKLKQEIKQLKKDSC